MLFTSLSYLLEHYNLEEVKKSYLHLLSMLTTVEDLSNNLFENCVISIGTQGDIIVAYIIVDKQVIITGSGTIFIEQKIIHGGRNVGHIEDIVVHSDYRGQDIAKNILSILKDIAKNKNCYKCILNCKEELEIFYVKNGYIKRGICCSDYLE